MFSDVGTFPVGYILTEERAIFLTSGKTVDFLKYTQSPYNSILYRPYNNYAIHIIYVVPKTV